MNLAQILSPILDWYIRGISKKNLTNYNQKLTIKGLNGTVKISRDQWAVPHIEAKNENDLFFAQGYVHAQDRLWQMEMNRRISQGRLSEIFGKIALDSDRILRTFGFHRLGKKDWEKFKNSDIAHVGESYAAGVNAYIENCKNLPVEFKLLKFKPELWTAEDCITYGRFTAFKMSYGWLHEIERMKISAEVGIKKAAELHPEYPNFNPSILKEGIETYQVKDGRMDAFEGPFMPKMGGSNSWSVSAELMQNGSAVLCNDPHLALNMPNIWYENHLICPEYEVTGVSLLGIPMVLIGHNRKIAWGATLSFVDMQDCYIEHFTDDTLTKYQFNGEILNTSIIQEEIKIKGINKSHIEKVVYTHHGPVISSLVGVNNKMISLQSSCLKENNMLIGFYNLNKSNNWDDFVNACSNINAPSLNLNYADIENNIGYYVTGTVPLRRKDEDLLPRDGSKIDYEWNGSVPFEKMPHLLNPKKGYLLTCNNKVVNDDYPYDLGNIWMNGYRAQRLEQLFNAKEKYSIQDFKEWQQDLYSIPGRQFTNLFKRLCVDSDFDKDPQLKEVAEIFINWDGYLNAESIGGCIYQVFKQSLIDLIIGSDLDKNRSLGFRGHGPKAPILHDNEFWGHDSVTLLRLLEETDSNSWLKKSPKETILDALKLSVDYMNKHLGSDINNWKWGNLHQMTFVHVLGAQKPLDKIFNVSGIKIGGDTDTLNQIAFLPGQHYGGTLVSASFRQIIDMGNFDNSVCCVPTGQSGNLISKHRMDQFEKWIKGEYKPMIWSNEQIEKFKKYEMNLEPI